jgi:acyl-CoA thioesterase YciA
MTLEERYNHSECHSLEQIFPNQTNPNGTAFGGHIVSIMDKVAGFAAGRFSGGAVVTASMDKVDFRIPIKMGEVIEVISKVESVGRTSMRIKVDVLKAMPNDSSLVTSGYFTFVAIDQNGKPRVAAPSA